MYIHLYIYTYFTHTHTYIYNIYTYIYIYVYMYIIYQLFCLCGAYARSSRESHAREHCIHTSAYMPINIHAYTRESHAREHCIHTSAYMPINIHAYTRESHAREHCIHTLIHAHKYTRIYNAFTQITRVKIVLFEHMTTYTNSTHLGCSNAALFNMA